MFWSGTNRVKMNVQRANPDLIPLDSKPIQNFQISRTCLVPQTTLTVQQKNSTIVIEIYFMFMI